MILMVFKLYVYNSKVSGTLNFNTFLHQLVQERNLEKGATFSSKQTHELVFKKQSIVENVLPQ